MRTAKKGEPGKQAPGPTIPGHQPADNAEKRGVSAFFGTWPGEETDSQLDALLREIRNR